MAIKNKMQNHFMEATGLRVISMYIQEYFHWGWQEYDQQNDNGIDGEIIPWDNEGNDPGVRIYVQSKCGPGYISSEDDNYLTIKPYNSSDKFKKHIRAWNNFTYPVVLIFTNPQKENKNGDRCLDLKNPKAYWIRVDTYIYGQDGNTIIKIPKSNLFQEHSKGDLKKMIKNHITNWTNYPLISLDKIDYSIINSTTPIDDAKAFYENWSKENSTIDLNGVQKTVKVTRVGWRHITDKSRNGRVLISLKLLPIAKKILESSNIIEPVILKSKFGNAIKKDKYTINIGYRAKVNINNEMKKVQVVLKKHVCKKYNIEKYWFYSVHIVK